jgi:hypothetical protein
MKFKKYFKGVKLKHKYKDYTIYVTVIGKDLPEAIESWVYKGGKYIFSSDVIPIDIHKTKWNKKLSKYMDFDRRKFKKAITILLRETEKGITHLV